MPNLDPATFQVLTLALLAATLLTALAILLTLRGIRRALEHAGVARASEPAEAGVEASGQTPPPGGWLTGFGEGAGQTSQPAPGEATGIQVQEPASTPSAHAASLRTASDRDEAGEGQAAPAAADESAEATDSAAAPAAREEIEPHPLDEAAAQTGEASALARWDEEPQDQPFERDGRWWFKRGDELLVYDDDAGEWQAAPAMALRAATGAGAIGGWDAGSTTAAEAASTSEAVATQVEPGDDLRAWRCPSCGAINGSTSTSCRMCFTARAE